MFSGFEGLLLVELKGGFEFLDFLLEWLVFLGGFGDLLEEMVALLDLSLDELVFLFVVGLVLLFFIL